MRTQKPHTKSDNKIHNLIFFFFFFFFFKWLNLMMQLMAQRYYISLVHMVQISWWLNWVFVSVQRFLSPHHLLLCTTICSFSPLLHTRTNLISQIWHFGSSVVTDDGVTHFYTGERGGGNFSDFVGDGSYRCANHPIDLQHGLLLQNPLLFTSVAFEDFSLFKKGGEVHLLYFEEVSFVENFEKFSRVEEILRKFQQNFRAIPKI